MVFIVVVRPSFYGRATRFSDHVWALSKKIFDFYKKIQIYPEAKPNAAHAYLAALEKTGKLKAIATQMIVFIKWLA